jgi:hypothetical protein
VRNFTHQEQLTEKERLQFDWTNNRYFQFRYESGSYKSRKIAVNPKLITVKYNSEKLALYGKPENGVKPIQIQALKGKLSYWKQIDKERSRALKLASKKSKRTTYSLVATS